MEITIDFSEVKDKIRLIAQRAPHVLDEIIVKWLLAGAQEVHHRSSSNARKIHGVTGAYRAGFHISPVNGYEGNRSIVIFNMTEYSIVMEYGAKFTNKQPPPGVLDEWVRKIIAPGSPEEVKRIAYLIGRSFVRKGRAGKKALKAHKVMTRAYKDAKSKLDNWLKSLVSQGLAKL